MRRRGSPIIAALSAAVVLSSCGLTVPTNQTSVAGQNGTTVDGSTQGTSPGVAGQPLTGGGPAGGGTGTQPGSGLPGPGGQARSGVTQSGTSTQRGASTPSTGGAGLVPRKKGTLLLGIQIYSNSAAAQAAFGLSGDLGDPVKQYQILLDDLNSHGGILGQKVVANFVTHDLTGSDIASQEQATCTQWTRDQHVFAAIVTYEHTAGLIDCLEKAGAATMGWGGPGKDGDLTYQHFPHYSTAGSLNMSRLATNLVEGLFAQGFFHKGGKIGLLQDNSADTKRAVENFLKPALARHGLKVDQEASHSPTYTVGEVGSAGAQEQNAVLQFRSANITEVLSLDNSSVSPLFMRYADSQGYKPRYGISTEDNPAIMTQVVPPAALVGSLGVGYDPVNDVVNPPLNSAGKKCDALMRAHGQPVGAYGACDQVRLIADALTASGVLTRDGLMSGLARLGNIESAQGILLNYGGGRRDGVAAARNLVFDGNNWRYSGPRYGLS